MVARLIDGRAPPQVELAAEFDPTDNPYMSRPHQHKDGHAPPPLKSRENHQAVNPYMSTPH